MATTTTFTAIGRGFAADVMAKAKTSRKKREGRARMVID
jgi:hypothetical protein